MAFRDDLLLLQRDAQIAKAKRTLVLGWVWIGLAIGLGISPLHLMLTGENALATLVVLESTTERGLFGETQRVYPHVEFTISSGETIVFKDRFSDEQSPWKVGDKLNVLYFRDAPQEAVINRGMGNFSWSAVAISAALVCLLAGFRRLYSERKKYRHALQAIDNESSG